ncbi:hypothetical protein ASPCADRAFT_126425 [Aspergillus carbonarius ITEM 5010]|uniref:Uncharacterized protein n=1 Tax=Aspergillus carbonarius (strain ITEM 5010) TaxID=602072 RepID=A0A1R3RYG2_ASPC5|nr:hypothetical protein ASPCADRAFT_126425 [Aspergillus carbonarius ITEM 5010]
MSFVPKFVPLNSPSPFPWIFDIPDIYPHTYPQWVSSHITTTITTTLPLLPVLKDPLLPVLKDPLLHAPVSLGTIQVALLVLRHLALITPRALLLGLETLGTALVLLGPLLLVLEIPGIAPVVLQALLPQDQETLGIALVPMVLRALQALLRLALENPGTVLVKALLVLLLGSPGTALVLPALPALHPPDPPSTAGGEQQVSVC